MAAAHRLSVVDAGDGVVIVSGELDAATADRLAQHLKRSPAARVLDVSAVSFIDASGLRVLLAATDRNGERRLVLREPSRSVMRLLDITGLTGLLAPVAPEHRPFVVGDGRCG